jgi:hypothetical protein
MSAEDSAKDANFVSSVVPLGRWGEPEELAKAVLFLARRILQRGRVDGGGWTYECPVWNSHSSRLTIEYLPREGMEQKNGQGGDFKGVLDRQQSAPLSRGIA